MGTIRVTGVMIALVAGLSLAGCSTLDSVLGAADDVNKMLDEAKINTKAADDLMKELQGINTELEDINGSIYTSTETVHAVVAPYKAGEFPVLTKNWETVNAELKKAKGKQKKEAQARKKTYEAEMAARALAAATILDSKEKRKALLGKLKAPELQMLRDAGKKLKAIPDRNIALTDRVPKLIDKSVEVIADIGKQVADNPAKALDAEKIIKKLNKSVAEAKRIPTEAKKQLKSVKALLKMLEDLL